MTTTPNHQPTNQQPSLYLTIQHRVDTMGMLSLKELNQLLSDLLMQEQLIDDDIDNAERKLDKTQAEAAHPICMHNICAVRHRLRFIQEQNRKRIPALTPYELDALERYYRSEAYHAHQCVRGADTNEERKLAKERHRRAEQTVSEIMHQRDTRFQDQQISRTAKSA